MENQKPQTKESTAQPNQNPPINHDNHYSPTAPPGNEPAKITSKKSRNKLLLILLAVVLVIAAGGAYWQFGRHSNQTPASVQMPQNSSTQNSSKPAPTSLPKTTLLNGDTYLETPLKLADLKFFINGKAFDPVCQVVNGQNTNCKYPLPAFSYYQIGSTHDGKMIIVADGPPQGPGGDIIIFALKSMGKYQLLSQMQWSGASGVANFDNQYKKSLASNISFDDHSKINDIIFPANITIAGQKLSNNIRNTNTNKPATSNISNANFLGKGFDTIRGYALGTGKAPVSPIKVGSSGIFDFYKVITVDKPSFNAEEIYGTYNKLFSAAYNPAGELAAAGQISKALKIHWYNGVNNVNVYGNIFIGCGYGNSYVVAKNISASNLTTVGLSPGGQALYQLPLSNALVQKVYNEDYGKGTYLSDKKLRNLSIGQFANQHGYFIAKNAWGEYVLFVRQDMITGGGCAKPVIYLYPPKAENVSVEVGGKIVKSDPFYGNGWSVFAQPNGQLAFGGKSYDSLFWEGYGWGQYPNITVGTVVAHSQLLSTIQKQLALQGLNQKEVSDFLAYWTPKLPSSPYVRLTWLSTADLNRLAPLSISPQPDTLIRTFLDFEGLNRPVNIAPQSFTTPSRHGFTVVEWGGLLRNGLN